MLYSSSSTDWCWKSFSAGLGEVAFNILSICLLMMFFYVLFLQDIAVSRDGLRSESSYDVHQEIMVDSVISQSRHVEMGRELQRWVPDEDDPQCPELENLFDGPWNRWFYISLIISNQFFFMNNSFVLLGLTHKIAGALEH